MFFPKGTPRPVIDRLNAAIKKALETNEIKKFYPRQALDPVASSPEELGALLKREIAKYAKVIKAANVRVE
ncbi:Tripartite tricarboxylate transporter family receptor [compost metagenome]